MNEIEDLEKKAEEKTEKRERRKNPKMKVSGKKVFELHKILAKKRKNR